MRLTGTCAILALTLAASPAAAAPIEAYGRLPSTDNLEISPDGSQIALVASSPTDRQVQVRQTSDLSMRTALRIGDVKVIGLQWVGANHLVVVTGSTANPIGLQGPAQEFWVANMLDLRTGKASNPLDTDADQDPTTNRGTAKPRMNSIFGWPHPEVINGKPVVFLPGMSFAEEHGALTIYRADLEGGSRPTVVATGDVDTDDILVDATGKQIARTDYDRASGAWTLWAANGNSLSHVLRETYPIDRPNLIGLGRNKTSVIIERTENDISHYYEVGLNGGGWSAPIAALDGASLVQDPGSQIVLVATARRT